LTGMLLSIISNSYSELFLWTKYVFALKAE
jgi:hypothetical protein